MKRNLEIKIAYWYYTLGLTQDEIARRLSMTRQKVNQIIRSLESQGIISISIHGFERDHIELESRLEEQFNLNEVLVVSDYGEKETAIYRVANVAAQYLDEMITQGMRIGVSWGRTLSRVISEQSGRVATEIIREYVIAQARLLLSSGEYNVQQVANLMYFPNASYFGRYFLKATGITPKQFQLFM